MLKVGDGRLPGVDDIGDLADDFVLYQGKDSGRQGVLIMGPRTVLTADSEFKRFSS